MFDNRLKPMIYEALKAAGVAKLPKSWTKSISHQAMETSMTSSKKV